MPDPVSKVILITGASSGIGRACAGYLSDKGHKVYGLCRSQCGQGNFHFIRTDCTIEEEVRSAVRYIIGKEGRIDILINNAGINLAGAVEHIKAEEAKMQFETNFFGALNLVRCVLPFMRNKESGTIINISSIAGRIGLPFQGMYCASKFALEGLTESLRMELKGSGVRVTLIEPGDFCTPITRNRLRNASSATCSHYSPGFVRTMEVVEKDERSGSDPMIIAHLTEKLIHKKKLKVRYVTGKFSERLALILQKILPAEIFERILITKYRV